jgi:hypothetical protein
MDDDAALRTGRLAGMATLVIGAALVAAPTWFSALAGIDDRRLVRGYGVLDPSLVPGLLAGRPRWPWLAARAAANVGLAAALVGRGRRGASIAAMVSALTVVDARAARRLHASAR